MKKTCHTGLAAVLILSAFGCTVSSSGSGPSVPNPLPQNSSPSQPIRRSAPTVETKKSVVFGDELKDSYGYRKYVSHDVAEILCKQQGGALPSVRDFAEFAIQNGSYGIKPTAYPNGASPDLENAEIKSMSAYGFAPIYRYSPQSKVIAFYFKKYGFRAIGVRRYWTADMSPPLKPSAVPYFYVFYNQDASFFPELIDDGGEATICVFEKK